MNETENKIEAGVGDGQRSFVMPEVTFASLILSFNTSALFHMGEISDPESGEKVVNLDMARNAIDTLALLKDKTSGNLDSDEEELLIRVLYELKTRFVRVSR